MRSRVPSRSRRPEVQEAVRKLLEEHPDMPNRTLARMLVEQRPDLWGTGPAAIDSARMAVQYHRGSRGQPRVACPESRAEQWSPYRLPDYRRVLLLADLHLPYHDRAALETAVEHARAWKPDCVLLDGDALDFCALSHFERDPRNWSVKAEQTTWDAFVVWLRSRLGKTTEILVKEGNHEERLRRYLWTQAPALAELDGVSLETVLGVERHGVRVVADKRPITRGRLHILHGHEYGRWMSSPVNPARGIYLRAHECVVVGHQHQSSSHSETTLGGRIITTWSVGCLCHLHPRYRPLNRWNHGWAWVEFGQRDEFFVRPWKLVNGEAFPA